MAYRTLIRLHLEFASAIWDPHEENTHEVRRLSCVLYALRWTMSVGARTTSVTSSLQQLDWQTLEERRNVARLCLFYKIVKGVVAAPLPKYIQPIHKSS